MTLPRIAASAAHSVTVQSALLADGWRHGEWVDVATKILDLVAAALPVLGVCCFLAQIGRQIVGGTLRRTKGKPGKRAVAAMTSMAVIAGLVWAWCLRRQGLPRCP